MQRKSTRRIARIVLTWSVVLMFSLDTASACHPIRFWIGRCYVAPPVYYGTPCHPPAVCCPPVADCCGAVESSPTTTEPAHESMRPMIAPPSETAPADADATIPPEVETSPAQDAFPAPTEMEVAPSDAEASPRAESTPPRSESSPNDLRPLSDQPPGTAVEPEIQPSDDASDLFAEPPADTESNAQEQPAGVPADDLFPEPATETLPPSDDTSDLFGNPTESDTTPPEGAPDQQPSTEPSPDAINDLFGDMDNQPQDQPPAPTEEPPAQAPATDLDDLFSAPNNESASEGLPFDVEPTPGAEPANPAGGDTQEESPFAPLDENPAAPPATEPSAVEELDLFGDLPDSETGDDSLAPADAAPGEGDDTLIGIPSDATETDSGDAPSGGFDDLFGGDMDDEATEPAEPPSQSTPQDAGGENFDDLFGAASDPSPESPIGSDGATRAARQNDERGPAPALTTLATPGGPDVHQLTHTRSTRPAKVTVVRAAADMPVRHWTDNTGLYHTTARLVTIGDTYVRLFKENGRFTTVPLRRLSDVDRTYVEELTKNQAEGPVVHVAVR